jgi:hypothetical protein
MFGEMEGGERLDMSDDGLGHVPGLEQHLVGQRHGKGLHAFAHFGHQRQTLPQQRIRELFTDIALVAEGLHWRPIQRKGRRSKT